jgi:tRNA modification GTPase
VTRVRVLTPPGAGAIATVEVSGPRAWELARELFKPAGKPLPAGPELHRFWFGTLGGDEVILAVTSTDTAEVHCHGGVRVVRWVVEQFLARGCVEARGVEDSAPATLLQRAPTLRTAAILLDQFHGAFDREVRRILHLLELHVGHSPTYEEARRELRELARWAPVGRHLVEPWKVVVAGAPNVGKSSLVNALAGFQRAVVSDVAGTTRDVVSVQLAFDGWPVELTDTAGLREAEGLEAKGVERAKKAVNDADLILWVRDAADPEGTWPEPGACRMYDAIFVTNKIDLVPSWEPGEFSREHRGVAVSATAGTGIPELIAEVVRRLIPDLAPPPGAAVPYTPRFADVVDSANNALEAGHVEEVKRLLRDCRTAE